MNPMSLGECMVCGGVFTRDEPQNPPKRDTVTLHRDGKWGVHSHGEGGQAERR